jgi:integrase
MGTAPRPGVQRRLWRGDPAPCAAPLDRTRHPPHTGSADRRHTFAFALATETGNDPYELQRRLGHASQRYIDRYTNPPEDIAAGYIERL